MVESLIVKPNTQNEESPSKANKVVAEWFAKVLWKKKFKKSIIQEHDDQIVQVVKEVYRNPDERKDETWDWILDRDFNFMVHAAYKHRTENIVLICYRGTDFKDVKDIFSDIQIVLWVNWLDGRVVDSINFFDDVQMKYPDARKRICGHSLWWTISFLITKHRSPERCIVFNPWSSPTTTFLGMMMDTLVKRPWTKRITTYKIWWDIVSALSFIWNVKNFVVKSVSPLTLHTIDSFPALFEKDREENNK
jgi:hypothetical protein